MHFELWNTPWTDSLAAREFAFPVPVLFPGAVELDERPGLGLPFKIKMHRWRQGDR
jgi:hypothetical protein